MAMAALLAFVFAFRVAGESQRAARIFFCFVDLWPAIACNARASRPGSRPQQAAAGRSSVAAYNVQITVSKQVM